MHKIKRMGYHVKREQHNMLPDNDKKNHFDIQKAPQRLHPSEGPCQVNNIPRTRTFSFLQVF
jgi:hypothetical protein